MEGLFIQITVHGLPEENVPFHRVVLDPGLLGYVGHSALQGRMKREGGRWREGKGEGRGKRGGGGGRGGRGGGAERGGGGGMTIINSI